ncbi:MAG: hypothetical protein NZ517_08730 [Candidatus Nitrosocaldus sp.]|nr:hypothetical protein [Candidatus Nitrosocaldus sp.]MDW7999994.1 hypothetical protein [Candidatus Nitrosocaldus sp.]
MTSGDDDGYLRAWAYKYKYEYIADGEQIHKLLSDEWWWAGG